MASGKCIDVKNGWLVFLMISLISALCDIAQPIQGNWLGLTVFSAILTLGLFVSQ